MLCDELDGPSGVSLRRAAAGHGNNPGFHGTVNLACCVVGIHITIQDERALESVLAVKLDDIADHL